ncbi:hypothetical protein [Nocardia sp. NBC_00416]|uniref:hypothetical protein n=1 Tax=Nocardia sp. NBC_00416 TaxID=2975991 RepID=UPI002E1F9001
MLGGAAGGFAAAAIDGDGWTDLATGTVVGAAGGAVFHGVGAVAQRSVSKLAGRSSTNLMNAKKPKLNYASKKQALQRNEAARDTAKRGLDKANKRFKNSVGTKQLVKRRDARDTAKDTLKDAKDAVNKAQKAKNKAQIKAKAAKGDLAKAKNKDKWWQRANKQFGADGWKADLGHNWARSGLTGMGAALFPLGYFSYKNRAQGGQGDGAQPEGEPQTPLSWDGLAPATAEGVMWQPPFVMDEAVPTDGATMGFLLRPRDLHPTLVDWYGSEGDSFAQTLVDTDVMSGDPDLKTPLTLPKIPTLPESSGLGVGVAGAAYKEARSGFETSAKELGDQQDLVAAMSETTVPEIQKILKEKNAGLIAGVNEAMLGIPDASETNFLTFLAQALGESAQNLNDAVLANDSAAKDIDAAAAEADKKAAQDLDSSVDSFANGLNDPSLMPDSSRIGENLPSWLQDLTTGDTGAVDPATSGLRDSLDQIQDPAKDSLQNPSDSASTIPAAYNPGASQLGGTGAMGGMGSQLGSLMSSMLPMMMQQAAMRNMQDSDLAGRVNDIDPARYDRALAPTMPQTQPAPTTPWSNQAAAAATPATPAQPAHNQTGAPSGATSTQSGAGLPNRVAGADGLVPYPFPDGRTQRVPLAVAQALDKAFANKSGTDAQAAYQGTAGAWTDPKDIGPAVDPFQLATGDVATWTRAKPKDGAQAPEPKQAQAAVGVSAGGSAEGDQKPQDKPDTGSSGEPQYRTALLVAFGEGESGTLEALVNGELQQYAPELADADGQFGDFAGFKHPKGVEAGGDKGQDSNAGVSADQGVDVPAMVPA